jgi:hypothetical protein
MGIGYPIACLILLLAYRYSWAADLMDRYPLLLVATLASFVCPLVIVGWLEHQRRKSKSE